MTESPPNARIAYGLFRINVNDYCKASHEVYGDSKSLQELEAKLLGVTEERFTEVYLGLAKDQQIEMVNGFKTNELEELLEYERRMDIVIQQVPH